MVYQGKSIYIHAFIDGWEVDIFLYISTLIGGKTKMSARDWMEWQVPDGKWRWLPAYTAYLKFYVEFLKARWRSLIVRNHWTTKFMGSPEINPSSYFCRNRYYMCLNVHIGAYWSITNITKIGLLNVQISPWLGTSASHGFPKWSLKSSSRKKRS